MSLFPVIGTDVPEAANGVDTPGSPGSCNVNGPYTHAPNTPAQLLKFGGRVPCPGQGSLDETENCVDGESACDGQENPIDTSHNSTTHSDTQQHSDMFPAHPSLPLATCTADTEPDPHEPPKDMSLTGPSQTSMPLNETLSGDWQHTGTPSKDTAPEGDTHSADKKQSETKHTKPSSFCAVETEEEKEVEVEEECEKDGKEQHAGNTQAEVSAELTEEPSAAAPSPSSVPAEGGGSSAAAPSPSSVPAEGGESSGNSSCPPHVMAQVRVRNVPERERIVRGMQDSKSLDEISQACIGGARGGGRGGQPEGRRATISSALELEGTVSHDGDLTHFICRNLEQKIKMSSKPSLDCDCDSDCSGSISSRGHGSSSRRPVDIPPIDPAVLVDLQRHTEEVAHSVELMMRSLNGTIQNMTALSVGYIQTYRDSVDSLGESVDMSIKGMYTLMARCEELDRSMQPIHTLAAQIRDIKRTLDALEAICK
uniref:BLOC-1 related complex subunit 6 n=1 Tax=Oncorhynchus gorbuscha TaxID=8017 RepID=UPI001EAEAF55|nr:BLOC-1 related complex subunit 6 [Oncorhynchus gorbuscha]